MENKKSSVPKLRFPGFTGAWEQRKLSELIQKGGSGGTPKSTNKAYYNGNIPFLGISDISKSNGYIDDTEKYISEKGLDNSSAWIVPKGAISLAMYASVGKLAILNTDAATSQAFYNMVFEDVSIRDYIYHRLGKANEFGEWTRLISTGTQSNLNADKVKNFKIQIPQIIDEIKNISTFFNQLDSLIALHQRKLEHLKEQKKGLLQKMFPKNGEVVPEVRFPGFTDDWEQRKLGEVATRVTRKNKNLESTLPLTISAQLGLVDQISYFDKRIASSNLTNYILLKRGEFAYNKSYSNGYPFGAVKRLNNYASGVIPSLYIAFFPNNKTVNSNFMETYFETNLWHKEVSTRATEGARNHGLLNISPTDFMDINIRIPMIMKEQVEITKFLHNVDTLITLHQRKLEHLKLMKKGLLQQMFV